jgi:hypothetical protein
MTRRPLAVTLIGWLFLSVGAITISYFISQFIASRSMPQDLILACAVDALALAGGLLILRGRNLGRWLSIGWLAFHVGLSVLHATQDVVVHGVLLVLVVIALTRRDAALYFRRVRQV